DMKRSWMILAAAVMMATAACTGGSSTSNQTASPGGVVNIILWHGYSPPAAGAPPNLENVSLNDLADQFNASHPNIHVQVVFCCENDFALQKLTVALQGDKQPDIAYEYG